MTAVNRHFIDTEFGQMHIRIAGPRRSKLPPLICLHMAPQSGQDFETLMWRAGDDRLIIAPDYHGYGESSPLPDEDVVTIETYAKSIWQTVDALGLGNIEILGYHTGSKVAIEMALQRPNQALGLLCISLSTMAPQDYERSKPSFSPLSFEPGTANIEAWWRKLRSYYDPAMAYEDLVQKFAISIKSGANFHLGFKASHLYNETILEKLTRLDVPVLLVNPNDDLNTITPLAASYIPLCSLIEKPDWLPGFLEIHADELHELIKSVQKLKTLEDERKSVKAIAE